MRKWIGILLLCASVISAFGHGKEWLTDFGAAKKLAAAEKKRILMLFTGSDWCPYCIQWEKEVFSKAEFQDYAKANFVLLLVDFPDRKKLSKAQERANDALKDKYNVEEYPMVYILDAKGKELTRFNYTEGGLDQFQKKAQRADLPPH
jgi:thioredoxin-related protein